MTYQTDSSQGYSTRIIHSGCDQESNSGDNEDEREEQEGGWHQSARTLLRPMLYYWTIASIVARASIVSMLTSVDISATQYIEFFDVTTKKLFHHILLTILVYF